MKANTRLIKVLVPSVIAVIIIAIVSIMIVRENNKDSSVSENPTTAPAVEEKQTMTHSDKTEVSTEIEIESQVEEVTETPTEEIEVPTEVEEQTPIENTYYEEPEPTYNEPTQTYEEPAYTPPAPSGKIDSLINGDDDNSSYDYDPSKSHNSGLRFG